MTNPNNNPTLILASTSKYRSELLKRLNLEFQIIPSNINEAPLPDEAPKDLAARLALAKAREIAAAYPKHVVIGSDQVAELNGKPLGKPGSHEGAIAQLTKMSGQIVYFHTCVSVIKIKTGFEKSEASLVKVKFKNLTKETIQRYVEIEKPYDCAGSAKSEGLGISLLEYIENDDPTALIGLPLIKTTKLLTMTGFFIP